MNIYERDLAILAKQNPKTEEELLSHLNLSPNSAEAYFVALVYEWLWPEAQPREKRFKCQYVTGKQAGFQVTLSGNRIASFVDEVEALDYCRYREDRLELTGTTAVNRP